MPLRFLLVLLTLGTASRAVAHKCDVELNEGRRILFERRLIAGLRDLRRSDWVIRRERVNAVRAIFRSNQNFELDDDTVRLRGLISSDVFERRLTARDGHTAALTLELARALKLFGRVLAVRDDAYLVALPPPSSEYVGYQFMPFDLYFVMPLKAQAQAGSRARNARRRVAEGVHGVTLRVGDDDDDTASADWYLIEYEGATYAERLLRLTTDDLIAHPSYRRATLAF